jgi:hypothetical protein
MESLTKAIHWIISRDWGTASDVVGAIANTIMAIAALWGVKTANNWISSKANKAADDVFDELHSLYGKYLKVFNMAVTGYDAVCRMYGVHDKLKPAPFSAYEELKLVEERSSRCYELLSAFKDTIRRSLAVKTKYKDGGGHIDFVKILPAHDEFFSQTIKFFKATRIIIAQQNSDLNKEEFQKYQMLFKEYEKIYDSVSKLSHNLKMMEISDIFEVR